MNDVQNGKLNMAQRVLETLKRNETTYKGLPAMMSIVAELEADITNIRELQAKQGEINLPASTLEKQKAEKQMIKISVKVARILNLIGFESNNNDLITLNVSNNSFYRLPDNAELALATRILNLAKQYTTELATLSIDNTQITEMEKAIETFNTVIAKPMDVITEKKQQTTNLAQLFAKLNSILYDKLDKIMVLYKENHEHFYNEYRTSRNLIITSVRHQDKNEEASKN